MMSRTCRCERDVQAASMSGRWPATLAAHTNSCAYCRDVRRVVEALQPPLAPTPRAIDASALWACGRHARRIGSEARISAVIAVAQIGGLGGVLAVVIASINWSDVAVTLGQFRPASAYLWAGASSLAISVAAAVALGWLTSASETEDRRRV